MADHFSLTFVSLSLASMLYFHVWLQSKGKVLVWKEYYNLWYGIYQPSWLFPLEPQQSYLSNPEGY